MTHPRTPESGPITAPANQSPVDDSKEAHSFKFRHVEKATQTTIDRLTQAKQAFEEKYYSQYLSHFKKKVRSLSGFPGAKKNTEEEKKINESFKKCWDYIILEPFEIWVWMMKFNAKVIHYPGDFYSVMHFIAGIMNLVDDQLESGTCIQYRKAPIVEDNGLLIGAPLLPLMNYDRHKTYSNSGVLESVKYMTKDLQSVPLKDQSVIVPICYGTKKPVLQRQKLEEILAPYLKHKAKIVLYFGHPPSDHSVEEGAGIWSNWMTNNEDVLNKLKATYNTEIEILLGVNLPAVMNKDSAHPRWNIETASHATLALHDGEDFQQAMAQVFEFLLKDSNKKLASQFCQDLSADILSYLKPTLFNKPATIAQGKKQKPEPVRAGLGQAQAPNLEQKPTAEPNKNFPLVGAVLTNLSSTVFNTLIAAKTPDEKKNALSALSNILRTVHTFERSHSQSQHAFFPKRRTPPPEKTKGLAAKLSPKNSTPP